MGERTLFPNASTKETLAYCWRQMQPDRAAFTGACTAIVLGTLANAVAAPLIFASLLSRISQLGPHAHEGLWQSFGPLLVAYALVLVAATVFGRIGGWMNWGATLRSFGRAITSGYDHLMSLSHSWHTDRPSGEVIATLETSTWAFADMIDATVWGILRIGVTTIGAIVVLGVVAWPVALVMAGLVGVFALVLQRRMGRVVAAEKEFSDSHSRATGVIADTIANLTTVRSQAAEEREKEHVGALVADSIGADLRARKVFTSTRIQMESAMAFFNWAAIVVGVVLALHHVAAAGAVYLILFYATFVGTSLEESFEFIRLISRAVGRCAKFAGIAATQPDIVDLPGAPDMVVPHGCVEFRDMRFAYRAGAPLFEGLDLRIEPGEHVGLVGPSGSGKTTLTKLMLRYADRDGGLIEIDGQDIACVTQHSLRGHIAYVPQDPQMLHRTIAENICYGMESGSVIGEASKVSAVDMDLVRAVGRAAYVDEFVERLPDGYETVVGERGMKLSGGQRQRVAIAQAMAKGAKVLVLDEATSALDSESESLVQEALWHLMEGTTALVVAHRLATIARLDRIVVLDRGRVVEQGTHAELLAAGRAGVYGRLWAHQSGGFLAA
jgi:ATP-binding cassette subfamily B protein